MARKERNANQSRVQSPDTIAATFGGGEGEDEVLAKCKSCRDYKGNGGTCSGVEGRDRCRQVVIILDRPRIRENAVINSAKRRAVYPIRR